MPTRESKLARFERLAQRRVTQAMDKIRLVGNLADHHNYDYTEEHVRQIFEALDAELRRMKLRFKQERGQKDGQLFRFRKEDKSNGQRES